MTDAVVGRCYEMVNDNKTTYVGKFLRRVGGGPLNTAMVDYFSKDGEEIEIVSRYPDFHTYNEVSCRDPQSAGSRRRSGRRTPRGRGAGRGSRGSRGSRGGKRARTRGGRRDRR